MADGSYNRRQFLTATVRAVAGAALTGSVSTASDVPESFTLIDAHTHFYDPTRVGGIPWPPKDNKLLYRPVLPRDYRALPVPRSVTGTIVVEASPWVKDNQWVLNLAARDPFIVGFVGNLPVGTREFAGLLKRFAANPIFRGIRLRDRKLDGLLDDPAFAGDLKLLPSHNLSLDVVGGTEILPFAHRLARQTPHLRIIIDHLAGVIIDGKTPPSDWLRQMRELAKEPAIFCKLSGLVEGTGRSDGSAPRDVEFYRPVLDAMCKMFGPDRLIYASDWPVSEQFAPLPVVQGIIAEYFRSHGTRAENHVFSQSSKAAYGWKTRAKS